MTTTRRTWLARALILPVLGWNLLCAGQFLAMPDVYVSAFELAGVPGESAIRALGLLFVMWNVPYAVALWHPQKRRVSLLEALAMQTIGVVGESALLALLPAGHAMLRSSVVRFIAFDGAGVLLLGAALCILRRPHSTPTPN